MERLKAFVYAHRTAVFVCFALLLMVHAVLWAAAAGIFGRHALATYVIKHGVFLSRMAIVCVAVLWMRYQYWKKGLGSKVKIDEDCGVTFKVARFVSDTSYYYEQPGSVGALTRAMGVHYNRGNLEKLIVTVTNTTGAAIETDDSFFLEKQMGGRWFPVESYETEEPWQPMTIPVGQTECTFIPWRRYDTLEQKPYRILKNLNINGRTVTVGSTFWLG